MELIEKAIGLKAQERAIKQDPRYSDEYKARLLEQNKQAFESLKAEAFTTFKREWMGIAKDLDQQEIKTKAAENAEAARWDYQRLNYEAKAAQSFLATAKDVREVVAAYSKALDSGDREKARAWAEIGPGAVKEKLSVSPNQKMDADRLIGRMSKDLAALRETDELAALRAEDGQLVQKALDLEAAAKQLDSYFSPAGIGGYDRLPRLAGVIGDAGLKLTQDYDGQHFYHRLEKAA